MDLGVLLSIPLESVAVRAVLASLVAVMAVRLLLRSRLRTPRSRVLAAVAPLLALVAVVVLSGTHLRLPMVMLPSQEVRALTIPVHDGYLQFVPMAVPVVAGLWALIACGRLLRRGAAVRRVRAAAQQAVASTEQVPRRLDRLARSAAAGLEVTAPQLGLVDSCRGGAYVVGTRRPVMVVGRSLLDTLDDEELEGVLAHELAHVKRRDTQVASILGVVRDLMFFVPGGGWAVRQLHRERELAADQVAVELTGKPGALASGLLKVLDHAPAGPSPCAAFAPSGGVVDRIRVLVEDAPSPSPTRRRSETVAVGLVAVSAVVGALVIPQLVAGAERERDAVALVWSATPPSDATPSPAGELRAFDVYRRSNFEVSTPTVRFQGRVPEHSQDNRRAALHACADEHTACPIPEVSPSLGLRPPVITFDDATLERWEATPLGNFESPDGFRMYWLANQAG